MSEDFGSDFITIVDDDGQEFELEVLDSMDYNGESYVAFLPANMDETTRTTASLSCVPFWTKTATSCLNPSTMTISSRMCTSTSWCCSSMTRKRTDNKEYVRAPRA